MMTSPRPHRPPNQSNATTSNRPVTVLDARPTEIEPVELPVIPAYPAEVDTLLQLLRQLPPDVSSQAGAHIIRATLDQMGGSLSAVLRQAQDVQNDCLGVVREYLDEIDRCQERIRLLQANTQHCQDASCYKPF